MPQQPHMLQVCGYPQPCRESTYPQMRSVSIPPKSTTFLFDVIQKRAPFRSLSSAHIIWNSLKGWDDQWCMENRGSNSQCIFSEPMICIWTHASGYVYDIFMIRMLALKLCIWNFDIKKKWKQRSPDFSRFILITPSIPTSKGRSHIDLVVAENRHEILGGQDLYEDFLIVVGFLDWF